jgi:site-specific recombinase XerD
MENGIKKMLVEMQLRGMSEQTQKNYSIHVRAFQKFYGKPAEQLGIKEVREYLYYLLRNKRLSNGTINGYHSSLKFFYVNILKKNWDNAGIPRLKEHKKLPAILSKKEVHKLFDVTENLKHKCMLMTIYSSGLRVSEVTKLKVTDIDSNNMQLIVREGKRKKDRYTLLSQVNLEILRKYWKEYKPTYWLFPGHKKGSHISTRTVQKVLTDSKNRAGIKKAITVHTYIQTTCRYLHLMRMDILKVKSPLDMSWGCGNE